MSKDPTRYLLIAAVVGAIFYFLWKQSHPAHVPIRPMEAAAAVEGSPPQQRFRLTTPSANGHAGVTADVSTRSAALTSVRLNDAQFRLKRPRMVPATRDDDPRTPNPALSYTPPDDEGIAAIYHRFFPSPRATDPSLRPDRDQRIDLVTTWEEASLPLRMKLQVRRDGNAVTPAWFDFEGRQVADREGGRTWHGADVDVVRTLRGVSPYAIEVVTAVTNRGADATVEHQLPLYHWVEREEETGSLFGRRPWQITEGACRHAADLFRETRDEMEHRDWNARFPANARMLALSNLYFAQGLIPRGNETVRGSLYAWDRPSAANAVGSIYTGELWWDRAALPAGATHTYQATAYFGPKVDQVLAAVDPSLTDTISLRFFFWRSDLFNFVVRKMIWFLRKLHDFTGNWGVAIVLLTVCIRILLLPLLMKSMKSMVMMQKLKPELDEINKKFGDNSEARGLAMMELYSRHGLSPFSTFSGCLPLFAQLPIWAALYSALQTSVELFHTPFAVWYTDLSAPDPYFVLPLILGSLMFLQQKIMPPQGMDPVQAKMMTYFMPGFMTLISLFLPAGLAIYMLINTMLGIVQQWYTKRRMDLMNPPGGTGIIVKSVSGAAST